MSTDVPAIEEDPTIDSEGLEIVEESTTKSKILLRLTDKQHARVQMRANDSGLTINSYILTRLGFKPVDGRKPGRRSKKQSNG